MATGTSPAIDRFVGDDGNHCDRQPEPPVVDQALAHSHEITPLTANRPSYVRLLSVRLRAPGQLPQAHFSIALVDGFEVVAVRVKDERGVVGLAIWSLAWAPVIGTYSSKRGSIEPIDYVATRCWQCDVAASDRGRHQLECDRLVVAAAACQQPGRFIFFRSTRWPTGRPMVDPVRANTVSAAAAQVSTAATRRRRLPTCRFMSCAPFGSRDRPNSCAVGDPVAGFSRDACLLTRVRKRAGQCVAGTGGTGLPLVERLSATGGDAR